MSDPDDGDRTPADALQLVAHDSRLNILRALWDAENHSLPFSDLWRAVDVQDAGQFNYHLSKLEGRFLTHVDDHYELLYPGHRVVDAVQSGVFEEAADHPPVDCPGACPDCGGDLVFTYEDFLARVECTDCSRTVLGYPFDPGGFVGRDGEAYEPWYIGVASRTASARRASRRSAGASRPSWSSASNSGRSYSRRSTRVVFAPADPAAASARSVAMRVTLSSAWLPTSATTWTFPFMFCLYSNPLPEWV